MQLGSFTGAWAGGGDDLWSYLSGEPQAPAANLDQLSVAFRTGHQLKKLASAPRGKDETFHFAVLGDIEPGRFWFSRKLFNRPGVFERQIRAIQSHVIDFSIQLGDMVSRGIERNYLRFFKMLSKVEVQKPYLTVIGNHDRANPHKRSPSLHYRRCFGNNNYYFDRGCVRYVVADTSAHELTKRQLRWLDIVLRTNLRKVVFTHIPPASLSWTNFAGRKGVGGFKAGALEFTELMSKHGVERVFLGHIHAFGVQDYQGVRYVLTGGGGSPLFPIPVSDRFYHYIIVEAGPNGFKETVHSLDDGRSFQIPPGKILISR